VTNIKHNFLPNCKCKKCLIKLLFVNSEMTEEDCMKANIFFDELKNIKENFNFNWQIKNKKIRSPLIFYSNDKKMTAIFCKN